MDSSLKISVIIPVYNREGTLRRAIDSVLRQTCLPAEIIVVDDGSTEEYASQIRKTCHNDERIKLVVHEKNQGAGAARNTGLSVAQNPYVAFLDSDDEWLPQKLAVQCAAIGDDNTALYTCAYSLIDPVRGEFVRQQADINTLSDLAWGCSISPGSSLFFAKSAIEKVGLFDTNFRRFEDWDWLINAIQAGCRIKVLSEPLVNIYVGSPPSFDLVRMSTIRMRSKHLNDFFNFSFFTGLKFLSTLAIENAVYSYKEKRIFKSAFYTSQGIMLWPFRNVRFWQNIARALFQLRAS